MVLGGNVAASGVVMDTRLVVTTVTIPTDKYGDDYTCNCIYQEL